MTKAFLIWISTGKPASFCPLGFTKEAFDYSEMKRPTEKPTMSLYVGLGTCAVLLYGLGDLATTQLTLVTGGQRVKPDVPSRISFVTTENST